MANMPDIKKRQVGLRLNLETVKAVEKKFSREDDTNDSIAYIRALEEATRDVVLTADDYEWIAQEVRKNEIKISQKKGAAND